MDFVAKRNKQLNSAIQSTFLYTTAASFDFIASSYANVITEKSCTLTAVGTEINFTNPANCDIIEL